MSVTRPFGNTLFYLVSCLQHHGAHDFLTASPQNYFTVLHLGLLNFHEVTWQTKICSIALLYSPHSLWTWHFSYWNYTRSFKNAQNFMCCCQFFNYAAYLITIQFSVHQAIFIIPQPIGVFAAQLEHTSLSLDKIIAFHALETPLLILMGRQI